MKRAASPAAPRGARLALAEPAAAHAAATGRRSAAPPPPPAPREPMIDADPKPENADARLVDEKWRAYPNTVLEFEATPPLRIDLREPLSDDGRTALASIGLGAPFGVFTAENPVGENAEDAPTPGAEREQERANERREGALERDLRRRGVPYILVDGVSPDGKYREHCVATLMAREEAVALARGFGQLALFWYDGGAFWLLPALADKSAQRLPVSPHSS